MASTLLICALLAVIVGLGIGIILVRHRSVWSLPPKLDMNLPGFAMIAARSSSDIAVPAEGAKAIVHFKREEAPDSYIIRSSGPGKLLTSDEDPSEFNASLILDVKRFTPPLKIAGHGFVSLILDTEDDEPQTISIGVHALFMREGALRVLPSRCKREVVHPRRPTDISMVYNMVLQEEAVYNNRVILAICMSNLSAKNDRKTPYRIIDFSIAASTLTSAKKIGCCWPVDSIPKIHQLLADDFSQCRPRLFEYVLQIPPRFKRSGMDVQTTENYIPSNSSIISFGSKIIRLVRLVNYYVDEYGNTQRTDNKMYNTEYSMQIDDKWSIVSYANASQLRAARRVKTTVAHGGVEDCRLFYDSDVNKLQVMGSTMEFSTEGNHLMTIGDLDMTKSEITITKQLKAIFTVEKNHAPILGTDLAVHSWCPLKIYNMKTSTSKKLDMIHIFPDTELPALFHKMRGSSCGIPYPSRGPVKEYWFITHWLYTYTSREIHAYAHAFVRLDATTLRPVGYSLPFVFDHVGVEFTCGMIFDEENLIVTYTTQDAHPTEIHIPTAWVLSPEVNITCSP